MSLQVSYCLALFKPAFAVRYIIRDEQRARYGHPVRYQQARMGNIGLSLACDRCYGENPYLRMLKENFGQECRICFRPFTVFKWKGNKGIFKRTCVCQFCSKQKNICQVCTLDLEFGLPMDIRDKRCGKNGSQLLNENILSLHSEMVKPPPPSMPPPQMSKMSEKQFVFIPEKVQEEDEDDIVAKIVVQKELLKQDQQIIQVPENQQENCIVQKDKGQQQ